MFPKVVAPFVVLSLFSLCSLSGAASCGETSPEALRQLLAERRVQLGIQTEFPDRERRRGDDGYVARPEGLGPPSEARTTANSVMWVALVVFVAVLLHTVYENLRTHGGKGAARGGAGPGHPDRVRERMDTVGEKSDDLAARGDYAGAMHILLLQSVDEMRRRLGVSFASSLTSREILAQTGLDADARDCFGDIVGRVEISWFGAYLPNADDYGRCRDSYSALGRILAGEGRR